MKVKKYYADYRRDNGTIQQMVVDKVDLKWLQEHANQIEGIEVRWEELINPCKGCGLEEMPNAFMQYCDTCFKNKHL
jgi:hypothetical protein